MSSDEEDEIDCDTCTPDELSQIFDETLRISNETSIWPKRTERNDNEEYILYLDNSR